METSIKILDLPNKAVMELWQEAFGDSSEDIAFFWKNCKHKSVLGFLLDDKLAAMVFLVDCSIHSLDFKYIYAACTKKEFRSKGYMSALLDYCKKNYDYIALIPANAGLIDYYKKRGFEKNEDIENILFNEINEIKEYLFEGCELDKPFALAYLGG